MADSIDLSGMDKEKENPQAAEVCDDLIDKLMLPDDALDYTRIPNPKIRSFYKTVVKRILDKDAPIVETRIVDGQDQMGTPKEVAERAQSAVDAFYKTFPLKKAE
jgi:hypothetical protein